MTDSEKKALVEDFMGGAMSPEAMEAFRARLQVDKELLAQLTIEVEMAKSLDPDGDYQRFKKALGDAHKGFFQKGK